MKDQQELRKVLDEVSFRLKTTRYELTLNDMYNAIVDLLNALDDAEGEVECMREEFKEYQEMIEDNYRPRTHKEMGW